MKKPTKEKKSTTNKKPKPINPVGRPTKYTTELIEKSKDYVENYASIGDMIPSIAGLSVVLGIARETVRAWGHEPGKEEFSAILDKIRATAERVLVNKGLSGDFNSNIAKLVLGKHNYHERTEVSNDVKIDGHWIVEVKK